MYQLCGGDLSLCSSADTEEEEQEEEEKEVQHSS